MKNKSISERIIRIQKHLEVDADGVIGAQTLTALENRLFKNAASNLPDYALTISRSGMDLLIKHEISSRAYYNRSLKKPAWPGGGSGITIGIGYDLGYNSAAQIRKDWGGRIADHSLEKLLKVAGLKGDAARKKLGGLKSITIDLDTASQVFSESTLPRYAKSTRKAFPGIEDLYPDAQAALLSLVYNRGTAMSGSKRREMAQIKKRVPQQDYAGIATAITGMKRLWVGKGLAGLLKRRDEEAALVLNAKRRYKKDELIRV